MEFFYSRNKDTLTRFGTNLQTNKGKDDIAREERIILRMKQTKKLLKNAENKKDFPVYKLNPETRDKMVITKRGGKEYHRGASRTV